MFGGSHRNDTWEWTGAAWQDVTPSAGNPTGRYNHALAYDLARRRSVLFGGRGTAGRFADTWEWDGSGWSDKTPVSGNPGARDDHALAYDAERRCSVLFGGYGGPGIGFFDDTWCWDGSAWANVTPASGRPPARSGTALAYDSARKRVVLFGGLAQAGELADTWEWDGAAWTNVTPSSGGPGKRTDHALVYDVTRARVLLVGGKEAGNTLDDTWEWNGSQWTNLTASAGALARQGHALAIDPIRGGVVVRGEGTDNSTWVLEYRRAGTPREGCVYGVDTDRDGLVGCADPDCFMVCTPGCNPATQTCDLAWPRCGDGTCDGIESPRLCATDCGPPAAVCGDDVCQPGETTLGCPGDC
jgi:hypothetical protein